MKGRSVPHGSLQAMFIGIVGYSVRHRALLLVLDNTSSATPWRSPKLRQFAARALLPQC